MHAVFDALEHHAKARPDAIAFQDDKTSVTWSELVDRVVNLSAKLADAPMTIGIALAGGVDYVIADLAITLTGRRQVPLPFFFSKEQNAHILFDAKIGAVIAYDAAMFAALPQLDVIDPIAIDIADIPLPKYKGGAERVIYTSGSSGKPKGVVIGDRQLNASLAALAPIVGATSDDRHLSVLPLPQLLEQICGVFLPILAGAETTFRFEATKALFGAPLGPFIEAFETIKPTTSLLAPVVLGRWVSNLKENGRKAPKGLRFVAVGGASSSPTLINEALSLGIPVCEGYGLSECCAVVAMNRPGESVTGTVGHVLDGLNVVIEDGEITVSGPTVMVGYLNGEAAPERWYTGDLGHFDGDRLVIDGRKDALLVTGSGRNISPEWVEQRVNTDPRISSSALSIRDSDGALVLIIAATVPVEPQDILPYLTDIPEYAQPHEVIIVSRSEPNFLFPVGTPNRLTAKKLVNTRASEILFEASLSERTA